MKSSQVAIVDPANKAGYSDLRVLQSGGGWYVGTVYTDADGFQEPGSRDTDYFPTREEAEIYLKRLEAGEPLLVRLTP